MGRLMSGGWTSTQSASQHAVPRDTLALRVKDPDLARSLERERVRADRSSTELSLVLFRFRRFQALGRQTRRLVSTLRHRARITDEVGAHGRSGAFALLPDTSEDGARRFAESVCSLLPDQRGNLSFELLTYAPPRASRPSRKDDEHGRGSSGNGSGNGSGGHSGGSSGGVNGNAKRGTDAIVVIGAADVPDHIETTPVHTWDHASVEVTAPCKTMHHLFERPTPLWKRLVDMSIAGAGIIVMSPVMAVIAVAIKLDSPGPVVFRQRRAGLGGRPFTMFKFRTMIPDAESRRVELQQHNEIDGPAFKIRDDPRITHVGALLRKTSLDELPQLFNVLLGDMTLVGPRPLPCAESDACEHWHLARLHVAPGLTCTWQISGRNDIAFDEWMRMDIDYVRNRSPWTDLRILAGTLPAVVTRRGAY